MKITKKQLEEAVWILENELYICHQEKEEIRSYLQDIYMIFVTMGLDFSEVFSHPDNDGKVERMMHFILKKDVE